MIVMIYMIVYLKSMLHRYILFQPRLPNLHVVRIVVIRFKSSLQVGFGPIQSNGIGE